MRDARQEFALNQRLAPETSTDALAMHLLDDLTPPSQAAMRAELRLRLQEALNRMDAIDREVLALRHFEELTPAETAQILGIDPKAAGMRYIRALRRLRDDLGSLPGGSSELHS
jgi:RNA polymerase sigma-70 factor (ECF subfamily)